jgi:hypothetical protein
MEIINRNLYRDDETIIRYKPKNEICGYNLKFRRNIVFISLNL